MRVAQPVAVMLCLSLGPAAAWADVVDPTPIVCPVGSVSVVAHGGPYCAPAGGSTSAGGSSSVAGSSSSAGGRFSPSGGAGSAGGSTVADDDEPESDGSACGCRLPRPGPTGVGVGAALGVLGWVLGRRRRRCLR